MRFLIISHVKHKRHNGDIYGYGPYIKEMNLWLKHVEAVEVVAPIKDETPDRIDLAYVHEKLKFTEVPSFNLIGWKNRLRTLFLTPLIFFKILVAMSRAEHIHLRCPGNMGLLGSVAQIFFPSKLKTAKYAGNWDPNSPQPKTYIWQKNILSNTTLSKNMKVLVYGEWEKQSRNIIPFFTATYSKKEIEKKEKKSLEKEIRLLFVGALSGGKRPLLSLETVRRLKQDGYNVYLDVFGEGVERKKLEKYIVDYKLEPYVYLHGNQNATVVKKYFQKAHFLIFISKSEGWPKVVAEAMFWGCLPITTNVSCVNYMVGYGKRGKITEPNVDSIVKWVKYYMYNQETFQISQKNAIFWSQQFTLERFEREIGEILYAK